MSKLDIINEEIIRRESNNIDLTSGEAKLEAAIEQFNTLDEFYRTDEKTSREVLECSYLESKHFTGKWPVVYSFADTEFYPFYNGQTDADCNPYFPISKVKDGSFDGLTPFPAPITRTGAHARDRDYANPEPGLRSTAISVLSAYPDTSGETTDPYPPGATATEKLRAALNPWRAEVVLVITDLCDDVGNVEQDFWQDILDDIDDILPAIQSDVVFPSNTPDFTPASAADIARDNLLANTASMTAHVVARTAFLGDIEVPEEEIFFGIIKLRLHQANGSFAKLTVAKRQQETTNSLILDNNDAIVSLNVLKVKNS